MTSRCAAFLAAGSGSCREIETLVRKLTWTGEGLECEGNDKHRRALLEGWVLNEESKAVNSAAVKPEEIDQEEDTEIGRVRGKNSLEVWRRH